IIPHINQRCNPQFLPVIQVLSLNNFLGLLAYLMLFAAGVIIYHRFFYTINPQNIPVYFTA
ncbi:hypothetical protein, partial [Cohnella mopanensis]|uniref:hypothetical protein n=1 Tax=Cohnella mopanensis TaxID=2911966 RepID=UPI001EF8EB6E